MSFMSFDYAMKAADAALQFQQNQSTNLKDTNQRVADVGKGNASRKDQLLRQKVEAEYGKASADIKAEKAKTLMDLAETKKQNAALAAGLVGAGHLVGGLFDAAFNKPKDLETPDSQQMEFSGAKAESLADFGYVSATKMGAGGNSEQGVVTAFDTDKGNFSVFGVNTTSGAPGKTDNLSVEDMAGKVWDKVKNSADPKDQKIKSMMSEGPPVMFKKDHFFKNEEGKFHLSDDLRASLFGGNTDGVNYEGFLNRAPGKELLGGIVGTDISGPYRVNEQSLSSMMSIEETAASVWGNVKDSMNPEDMQLKSMMEEGPPPKFKDATLNEDGSLKPELSAALFGGAPVGEGQPSQGFFNSEKGQSVLQPKMGKSGGSGYSISNAYQTSADSVMSLLNTDKVKGDLGIDNKTINKTEKSFEDQGLTIGWFDKGTKGASKAGKSIFKAVSGAAQPFLQMAEAWKTYAEEFDAAKAEYESAKKEAAAAAQKLLSIESQLVTAGAGT